MPLYGFMRLTTLQFETRLLKRIRMGINILKIFILEVYRRIYVRKSRFMAPLARVAVKLNFQQYIRRYTSPNDNFEYSYPLIAGSLIVINTLEIKQKI